jgi:hypothetical protein
MKIIVAKADGNQEAVELVGPIRNVRDDSPYLNSFICADGVQHFFDKEGFYDGWGMSIKTTPTPE